MAIERLGLQGLQINLYVPLKYVSNCRVGHRFGLCCVERY